MNDNIKKVAGLAVGTIAGRTLIKGTLKEGAKTPEGQAAISKVALGASKLSAGATKAKLAIGAKAALATKAIGATKVGAVALAAAPIAVPVIAAVGTSLLARKAYLRYKTKKLIRDKNKIDLKDRHNTWEERMRAKHNENYSNKLKDNSYSLNVKIGASHFGAADDANLARQAVQRAAELKGSGMETIGSSLGGLKGKALAAEMLATKKFLAASKAASAAKTAMAIKTGAITGGVAVLAGGAYLARKAYLKKKAKEAEAKRKHEKGAASARNIAIRLIRKRKESKEEKFSDEDSYDCGAGSPGMSSVGNMGGSTNRGLRPLRKNEESKAKQFVINKMLNSK